MNPWKDSEAFAREARKVESVGEALVLTLLWWRREGWTVRAQEPIEQYLIDLFVPEAGVAIEVDSFLAHSKSEDQRRDAAKRNLVVRRGWAPFTFSAQEAVFKPHDRLAECLTLIKSRLPPTARPGATEPRKPSPPDLRIMAAGGRALLDALEPRPADSIEEVHLSATLREMADRRPEERAGAALFRIVLERPALIHEPIIYKALSGIDGPVALAAAELVVAVDKTTGALDESTFLARCPSMLQPIAVRQLRDWASDPETAWARACEAAERIEPGARSMYNQARVDEMFAAIRGACPPPPPMPRRRL